MGCRHGCTGFLRERAGWTAQESADCSRRLRRSSCALVSLLVKQRADHCRVTNDTRGPPRSPSGPRARAPGRLGRPGARPARRRALTAHERRWLNRHQIPVPGQNFLRDMVVTMDAPHAQRDHPACLVEIPHAHHLVAINGDQPILATRLRVLSWKDVPAPHRGKSRALPTRIPVAPLPGEGLRPYAQAARRPSPPGRRPCCGLPHRCFHGNEGIRASRYPRGKFPRRGAAISRCAGMEPGTRM